MQPSKERIILSLCTHRVAKRRRRGLEVRSFFFHRFGNVFAYHFFALDIETAIGRLADRSYGLEAHALSSQNQTPTEPPQENSLSPRKTSKDRERREVEDTPHSYLRREEDEGYSPRHLSPRDTARYDDESPRSSSRSNRDSPSSNRKRSVSAKAGSSREKESPRDRTPKIEGKRRKPRKVWYDSDEEPHYYTDSDDDSEGDDSGSSGSNSSHESERKRSAGSSRTARDEGNLNRRASEPDALANRRKSLSRPKNHSASEARGDGLTPPPKASSSKLGKRRTSASTPSLPAYDPDARQLSDSFDLVSLGIQSPPPTGYYNQGPSQPLHSSNHQYQIPAGVQLQPRQQPNQGQSNGKISPRGAGLGVKVMDVNNLTSEDFGRLASRGFSASNTQPPQSAPQHSAPQPSSTSVPPKPASAGSVLPSHSGQPSLDPSMYQQLMLQQQQQLLQLQQQQLSGGQPALTAQASLTTSTSVVGQPSLYSSSSTPQTTLSSSSSQPVQNSLAQIQQQQLLLQQAQLQQAQLQQAQLQQQYAKLGAGGSGALPTAGAGLPQQQQQMGVVYVDPLTYLQYQQQQQLLQLQQQQLQQQQLLQQQLQKQYGAYPPSSVQK